METEYRTVYKGGEGEITEKKSRFIATVSPASSEEEALLFIESMRKKYWDARHNCFAYVIGKRGELKRFSDDGEPSGTAGKPILEVIRGQGLHGVMVIVIRYFGGTLLGTGGLVRAYSRAAKEAILASTVICRERGFLLNITTDYTGLGKIQYLLGQRGILPTDSRYTETVELDVLVSEEEEGRLRKEITEATSAQAKMTRVRECFFAEIDGGRKVLG